MGLIPTVSTARNDRHKDRDNFPRPVRRRGLEHLYDPDELEAYHDDKGAL
jgi:hypothetical protein